jgi:succinoglycan biosynthesis protein ExoA
VRKISVVVPMRNEAAHVERFVEDLAAQDFPHEVEVLVADGGSTDESVSILEAAARRAGLQVELLENPERWVSQGLNACVERARGDLIVRVDCHSRYPPDYLRLLATAAEETRAWNVGGIVVPEGRTPVERAVAAAMDSPFGGIGWTRHSGNARAEVDTVTYGAFRPEAFARAGLFDGSLIRNQDDEFNLRLRRAGGRIVLDPSIRTYYTPRGSYRAVFRQYFEYGRWKVPVMLKHRRVLSARSMAPVGFVVSLPLLAAGSVLFPLLALLLAGEVVAYIAAVFGFAAKSASRRGEPWRQVPRVAAVFPMFHFGYGCGMVWGWLSAVR